MEEAVRTSRLRQDLLFRINTITLQVPALRDRIDDLPLLCSHFLAKYAARHSRGLYDITDAAAQAMSRYHWPGNIRELEHVVERAVLLTKDVHIDLQALPLEVRCSVERDREGPRDRPRLMTLEQIERRALLEALERSNWNKQLAAASLGIYRPTLYSKMRKYAIHGPDRKAAGAR